MVFDKNSFSYQNLVLIRKGLVLTIDQSVHKILTNSDQPHSLLQWKENWVQKYVSSFTPIFKILNTELIFNTKHVHDILIIFAVGTHACRSYTFGCCISYFSSALIEHYDQKQVMGRKGLFWLTVARWKVHNAEEGCQKSRLIMSPSTRKKQRKLDMEGGYKLLKPPSVTYFLCQGCCCSKLLQIQL